MVELPSRLEVLYIDIQENLSAPIAEGISVARFDVPADQLGYLPDTER